MRFSMNIELDVERLRLAHKAVRAELLADRGADGRWPGQMSSSPLATAAAVSALVVAHGADSGDALRDRSPGSAETGSEILVQGELSELLVESLHWLARAQNEDGGWGDCDGNRSNLPATLLVLAAFRLTGVPAKYADLIARADQYVLAQGGATALRRWDGKEKSLAAPVLMNCALAGMIPWRQVPTLPYELVCVPERWQRLFRIAITPHAVPALVAVGWAKWHHDRPLNPLTRFIRRGVRTRCQFLLESMQAPDGAFLDAIPLTAFVVMGLASSGCQDLPVVQKGVEFLLASIRSNSSWSIYSNLATRNTALAICSLAEGQSRPPASVTPVASWIDTAHAGDATTHVLDQRSHANGQEPADDLRLLDDSLARLLEDQHGPRAGSTAATGGGWSWTNAPGAVPNVADTALALLALASSPKLLSEAAVRRGIEWLLGQQTEDGGWPAYCSCASVVFTDRTAVDSTALAVSALSEWLRLWRRSVESSQISPRQPALADRVAASIERALAWLVSQQRDDGSFVPLGFGNEHQPNEANPVGGTALVLAMCVQLEQMETPLARRAANWLLTAQHAAGGWGPPRVPLDYSGTYRTGAPSWRENDALAQFCTVEETALAVTALVPLVNTNVIYANAVSKGLAWLADAIEQDRHRRPGVLGWCFTRLWYHERLYPLVFAAGALSRAVGQLAPVRPAAAHVG
jgi:squalene-hopene/tetraprenyl-beta-curcumene cyclase